MRVHRTKKNITRNKLISFSKKKLLLVLVFLLASFHIVLALQTITSGAQLASLEQEEEKLVSKNKNLTYQLVNAYSLFQLREKAEGLGYMKPGSTLYLSNEDVFAKLP